jgi:exonuclease SbcC
MPFESKIISPKSRKLENSIDMIPLYLSISGFLSYRDPVELDFTQIDLACISGTNGAGKSSLLDAITWVLFSQARKRDDSLINAQSTTAEVSLIFTYEGNVYRIRRIKPRDKTMLLEFQILQDDGQKPGEQEPGTFGSHNNGGASYSPTLNLSQATWKPLTERSIRETEERIKQTLRLDYDTFVNASFFLQGKADQFTQQRPGDRKRILGSILGLEIWETYRLRAAERRKLVENDILGIEGRINEIVAELKEEETRKRSLEELEKSLSEVTQQRLAQQSAVITCAKSRQPWQSNKSWWRL